MAATSVQGPLGKRTAVPRNGVKDLNKASSVEEYVGTLLSRIQPAPASEDRRSIVAEYVKAKISQAFQPAVEVKAFPYGSVPLKTYLPDGDIDLAIFPNKGTSHQLKETWFTELSKALKAEAVNPHARHRVRDVQVIHAEVKLVKCLVDNIVVDISFQSLGGLYTVNFLESIDRRIDDHHLFKRSIILVKAWCYYESRLLGAHHGLISTYALETMVLYIFMVYHKSVTTPLKVLHKFLTVFSKFDWDNQCLSLRGPIPLSTFPKPEPLPFPDMKDPPLLKEDFMADMRHMYSPPGLTTEAKSTTPRAFQLKFLNIMDPLLPTNNLGRSVNKSSFARIRRALDYGAKRLDSILKKDASEDLEALKSFFQNTWNAQRSHTQPATPGNKLHPYPTHPSISSQRVIPAVHMGQGAPKTPPGHSAQQTISWPTSWPAGQRTQALLHPHQFQQMMLNQQNQAIYRHLLYPSMSLDSSQSNLHPGYGASGDSSSEGYQPWVPQTGQEKQGASTGSQTQKGQAGPSPKQSNQYPGNGLPASRKPLASKGVSEAGQYDERAPLSNGRSHREPVQQPHYSHSPVYAAMLPGMPHTLHPLVSSLPVSNYYADYYKATQPRFPQNGSLYSAARMPPGYVHLHPGAPPVAVSNSTTKAEQRHSDPGAALPKASDPGADILSGNLEQLSQQLQSATAMFNSQSAPSTSRGFGNSGQAESGPHAGGPDSSRPPMRSSSMGSLSSGLKPTAQHNGRRPRQEVYNGWFDGALPQISHHPNGTSVSARQRHNSLGNGRSQTEYVASQRMGVEQWSDNRPIMMPDRGLSQPSSPGIRQMQAGGPNPFNSMAPADWPLLNGKARPPTEYTDSLRWGSQSDCHSGWASPVGSVVSEQSLASLRFARLNGASPPPPPPSLKGANLPNGSTEAPQRNASDAQPHGKTWREDFVLAEEDFPGLPSSTPQSRNGTPTKDKPGTTPVPQWRPESRTPGMPTAMHPPKSTSEPVR